VLDVLTHSAAGSRRQHVSASERPRRSHTAEAWAGNSTCVRACRQRRKQRAHRCTQVLFGPNGVLSGLVCAMVSVGKLATGQADYYLEQAGGRVTRAAAVGGGVEDYYASGPESAGRWLGRGALALGLAGPVAADVLRTVLDGSTPDGHDRLAGPNTEVPGFDVTFSAPKSVSLLFALGSEQMQAAVLTPTRRP
jgi:hypothetical protein